MDSIRVLEAVGEPSGRQLIRTEPPAQIGERCGDCRKGDADQCESCQCAGLAEAPPPACWCVRVVRHLLLQSDRGAVAKCDPHVEEQLAEETNGCLSRACSPARRIVHICSLTHG